MLNLTSSTLSLLLPSLLQFTAVPAYYDSVYVTMARRGARVLALGWKDLGALSHQELRDTSRESAEQGLTFAGFVIISCPLKPDSKAVMRDIQHSSHYVRHGGGRGGVEVGERKQDLSWLRHHLLPIKTGFITLICKSFGGGRGVKQRVDRVGHEHFTP
jgi:hypothetical protein